VTLDRVVAGWYLLASVGLLNPGGSGARCYAGRYGVMAVLCWRGRGAALMYVNPATARAFVVRAGLRWPD